MRMCVKSKELKSFYHLCFNLLDVLVAEACGSPPQGAYYEALTPHASDPAQPSKRI